MRQAMRIVTGFSFALLVAAFAAGEARAEKQCEPKPAVVDASQNRSGPWLTSSYDAGDPAPSEELEPTAIDGDPQRCRVSRRRNECAVVTKQLAHYQGVLDLAEERGNELWEQSTQAQIDRLEERQDRFCPQGPSGIQEFLAFLDRAATLAAKGAVKAFTQGAF